MPSRSGARNAAHSEFARWILSADPSFLDLALAEATARDRTAEPLLHLDGGVVLMRSALSFWNLAAAWHDAPPIFVRHICPVLSECYLTATEGDLNLLADVVDADLTSWFEPALTFSVQTRLLTDLPYRPFTVNRHLSQRVAEATGARLDVRAPDQVLSVVCANSSSGGGSDIAYLGVSPAAYNLSDWAGGMRRFAREAGQVSRSEFKLLEALETFGIELHARGTALDLGASPGGWSRILSQREQYVTAVDPGRLHPSVERDARVRYRSITAEDYLNEEAERFDLIVNDMRMDARDSARLMVRFADRLHTGGNALITLKLPEQGRRGVLKQALQILRDGYEVVAAKQLFHNRSEITVHLRGHSKRSQM